MCGIAGLWNPGDPDLSREIVARMTSAISHRGPDDSGLTCESTSGMALGHRRLSIIDLSAAGHQPMASRSGRYEIVFNGEIYNFQELRASLEQAGAAFRGHSDTEVILEAVSAWGLERTVAACTGMFALALWDRERAELHLVRDRFGEKPLYYGWIGSQLAFASELKAIRAHPGFEGRIDRRALAMFLRLAYVPAPHTIYEGFRKVTPGTILTFRSASSGTPPSEFVYWSAREKMEEGLRSPLTVQGSELVDLAESVLSNSVRRQMVADVPLGAFLSGGIDSSLVTALMQRSSGRPVKTFTMGFDVPGYNEAEHARRVADHLGTDHTEMYVSPADALAVIPRLPALYDEPFADSSQVPTFLVSQIARAHVTVSLSGDGGDELFGGYNRYFWARRLWSRLRGVPHPVRRALSRGITAVPPGRWDGAFGAMSRVVPAAGRFPRPGDRMHKLAGVVVAKSEDHLYQMLVSQWQDPSALALGAREYDSPIGDASHSPAGGNFVDRMMLLDAVSYLPDDILVKVDRAAMGVSLETRAPFLDHAVAEFAWRVPQEFKVRGNEGKWLLRQVLDRHVPRQLIERPKMGFAIPIAEWLRADLRDWAEALLDPARLRAEGYLHEPTVTRHWQEHLSGTRNWQYLLWNVLMFQAWLEAQGAAVPASAGSGSL